MSGGSLTHLAAVGAPDAYLFGAPAVTFYKGVYQQHTNFAMEFMETTFNSANYGHSVTAEIIRTGDLLSSMYLVLKIRPLLNGSNTGSVFFVDKLGYAIINKIELSIGGTLIDTILPVFAAPNTTDATSSIVPTCSAVARPASSSRRSRAGHAAAAASSSLAAAQPVNHAKGRQLATACACA
eukprot:tig00000681_g3140.t1